ncbi:MAG: neutral zinc metallopeptidase [Rhizomicrobium sp.]
MELGRLGETMNVDDLRGQTSGWGGFGGMGPMAYGGGIRGGGMGFVGLIIMALLYFAGSFTNSGSYDNQYSAPAAQGTDQNSDAEFDFSRKIVWSLEQVWAPIMKARGVNFTPATITVYDDSTPTACGQGEASAGPFYCPNDSHIYLDLAFFQQLANQFGAPGQFAQAYVIAHEYGHHIQNLVGTMDKEQAALEGDSAKGATGASVRLELQADCYAGVWAWHANQQFAILDKGDIEGGLKAASAVGDDTLEKQQQGYVVPDSFTHGTSAQRMRWFKRGFARGDMDDCDTFDASTL